MVKRTITIFLLLCILTALTAGCVFAIQGRRGANSCGEDRCPSFADADGDGICDNFCGTSCNNGGRCYNIICYNNNTDCGGCHGNGGCCGR